MSGFLYKGKSTIDIIERRLVLCGTDFVDTVQGVQRDSQIGEPTITRPVPNDYGTINTRLQFEYSLMIDSEEYDTVPWITKDEQVIIEKWLTSPKFSSDLSIINDNEEILCTYHGKFISTNWTPAGDGFFMVTFTFECDTAYATEHEEYSFSSSQSISDWYAVVNCDTDEEEEYVYPVITITNTGSTGNVIITNNDDTGAVNSVTISSEGGTDIIIDCKHCILKKRPTGSSVDYSTPLSFEDVGWSDVGNIYWPRLVPGENNFVLTGAVTITFSYDVVRKQVGGWLYD